MNVEPVCADSACLRSKVSRNRVLDLRRWRLLLPTSPRTPSQGIVPPHLLICWLRLINHIIIGPQPEQVHVEELDIVHPCTRQLEQQKDRALTTHINSYLLSIGPSHESAKFHDQYGKTQVTNVSSARGFASVFWRLYDRKGERNPPPRASREFP